MLGNRIKHMRQNTGYTLVDLSKRSGIALATLSRIENDKMVGTLDSHKKICQALGITLSELFSNLEREMKAVYIQRNCAQKEVFSHSEHFTRTILTSKDSGKNILPLMVTVQPGGVENIDANRADIEKFIYSLEGSIELTIDGDTFQLQAEDTLYFNASSPHTIKNTGGTIARYLCVISP